MREFRPLEESTVDATLRLLRSAYPAAELPTPEAHRELLVSSIEKETVHVWTVHEAGELLGTLRTHDFRMNAFGLPLAVQGLGGVAVDLCHKKRKVARDIVQWFLEHSCNVGAAMTALFPFRISFYQRMGWGLGTPTHRFQLEPLSFPKSSEAGTTRYLEEGEEAALADCINRIQARFHGLFQVDLPEVKIPASNSGLRTIGVEFEGRLEAHLTFKFSGASKRNFLTYNLEAVNWGYETNRGLEGLFRFFRKQADQVRRIVLLTQDQHLHHLFADPLDGSGNNFRLNQQISERGAGVMYRMVDPAALFEQLTAHDFGDVDLTCGVDLVDGFWERTSKSFDLRIERGRARALAGESQATARLQIGVGDFSSMLLGVIPLGRLLEYGLATLSDPALQASLEEAFAVPEAPRCTSQF